jgi:hypothetical protein
MTTDTSQNRADAIMAALAVHAPPIGSIPPVQTDHRWQWLHSGHGELDLFVKDVRVSHRSDIDNRLAVLTCGAELHRVIAALAAADWTAAVTRQPHRAFPFHLATIQVTPRPAGEVTHQQPQPPGTLPSRRAPEPSRPVGADNLRALSSAVEQAGGELTILHAAQVYDLVAATIRRDRSPDHATPRPPQSSAEDTRPPEQHAVFAILHGHDDRPSTWLHAGEAFGAGCLAAADLRLSILPLTDAIRDTDTRQNIRRLLPGAGYPYLILRVSSPASPRAA